MACALPFGLSSDRLVRLALALTFVPALTSVLALVCLPASGLILVRAPADSS